MIPNGKPSQVAQIAKYSYKKLSLFLFTSPQWIFRIYYAILILLKKRFNVLHAHNPFNYIPERVTTHTTAFHLHQDK